MFARLRYWIEDWRDEREERRELQPERCEKPPKGWFCTREPNHNGPCAAWPEKVRVSGSGGDQFADPELPCSGCAHSASGAPFPGHPSGERPCGFCVRNPRLDPELGIDPGYLLARKPDGTPSYSPSWYDGRPPRKVPEDNYIATDRLQELIRETSGDDGFVIT